MVRMAVRGLFARKLRSALTGFAVVIGVAFVAGHVHLHGHDQRVVQGPVRARRRRASTSTSRPGSPSRATSAAGSSRCPTGTLEKVEARRRRRGGRAALRDPGRDLRRASASGSAATARPRSSFSPSEERFDPLTYVDGGPAGEPGQVTLDEATADREGFEVGDSILVGGRAPARRVRDLRHHERRRPALDRHPDAEHAARGGAADRAASRARSPRSSPPPRAARAPRSSRRRSSPRVGGTAEVRTGKEQADESAADINDSLGFIKIGAARVRRHRRARRQLPDLQHVRRHRRAALARVRAAAHARRVAPAGAQLRDRRDAR